VPIQNPALPPVKRSAGADSLSSASASRLKATRITDTHAAGRKRVYLDIQSGSRNVAYPPRPVPGSIADLDIVMEHCDFGRHKVGMCFVIVRSHKSLTYASFAVVCSRLFGSPASGRWAR
jgi:DDB1- and CUL4-associated factor 13